MFKPLTCFVLWLSLTAVVFGQNQDSGASDGKSPFDDYHVQTDQAMPDEIHGDASIDLSFDMEMSNSVSRPKRRPNAKKVQKIFQKEKDRLMAEVEEVGDKSLNVSQVVISNYYSYFNSLAYWQRHIFKCCPYSSKLPEFAKARPYQCASKKFPMRCFYSYYGLTQQWCCPIWPKVYITRCECCQCAVLLSTCAYQGRCQRRYRMTSFLAICHGKKGWGYIRYIRRYVSSSCYCKIG